MDYGTWITVAFSKIWDEQHKQCATQKKFRSKLHGRCSYHPLFRNDASWLYHMYWIYWRISLLFTPTHHQVSLWGFWHTFLDENRIRNLQVNLSSPDPRTTEGFQAEIKFTLANIEATATKSFVEERCSAACCLASGDFEMLTVLHGSNQFFVCLCFFLNGYLFATKYVNTKSTYYLNTKIPGRTDSDFPALH